MMLANPTVRVALATTHLPLREVPDAITRDGLERTLRILHRALRVDFGIAQPRIAVLGLNPHAGEDGHLGREEIDVDRAGARRTARSEGMALDGPLPADTAFLPAKLRECRRGAGDVPRPGPAGAEVQRLRAGGEPHARPALPARRGRPRHRAGSRRTRHRRSLEPVRRGRNLRAPGAARRKPHDREADLPARSEETPRPALPARARDHLARSCRRWIRNPAIASSRSARARARSPSRCSTATARSPSSNSIAT